MDIRESDAGIVWERVLTDGNTVQFAHLIDIDEQEITSGLNAGEFHLFGLVFVLDTGIKILIHEEGQGKLISGYEAGMMMAMACSQLKGNAFRIYSERSIYMLSNISPSHAFPYAATHRFVWVIEDAKKFPPIV